MLYGLESDHKIIEKIWIDFDKEQKQVLIPLMEEYRGDIGLQWCFIQQQPVI